MSRSSKRVTLKEIAEIAGVSTATVSIVLNRSRNYQNMALKTREKIERIAYELGYEANHMAKALRTQSTRQIGLVIPNIFNPFMPPLISEARKTADEHGYNLLLIDLSDMSDDQMRHRIQQVQRSGIIDGMMVHGCGEIIAEVVTGVPAVYLDTRSCTPSVCFTEEKASFELVELFVRQGLEKIYFINADIDRESFSLREKGYRQAMKEMGISHENVKIGYFSLNIQGGEDAYKWIANMSAMPEAVIVLADVMASGFILAAQRGGVSIPDQLAVASIDDLEISSRLIPGITCSKVDIERMSQLAASTLFDMLNHIEYDDQQVVPTQVIQRESSQKFGDRKKLWK